MKFEMTAHFFRNILQYEIYTKPVYLFSSCDMQIQRQTYVRIGFNRLSQNGLVSGRIRFHVSVRKAFCHAVDRLLIRM
jgi:hypothetical protein